jgi:hypothetical protein
LSRASPSTEHLLLTLAFDSLGIFFFGHLTKLFKWLSEDTE